MIYDYNLKGGADSRAVELREEILNTTDKLEVSGKCYYISDNGNDNNDGLTPETAWQTPDKLNEYAGIFNKGDAVLFERGGVYRTKYNINVQSGVTYAAYGKGEKPQILGSDMNYANPPLWKKTNRPNLWEAQLPLLPCENAKFLNLEPGIIVFDEKMAGVFKDKIGDIKEDFDFAYQKSFCRIYLYYSGGNPGEAFKSIEIGAKRTIFFGAQYVSDVTFDNLCIKHTGEFGIRFVGDNENITITNCEFGWIGGSRIAATGSGRFGNAIEFWCSAKNILIQNNWVYQIYDAGITPQGEQGMVWDGFRVIGNLIEYCTYSFELFCYDSVGWYTNGCVKDNVMRFAGYGWGQQRPECSNTSHYTSWTYDLTNSYENFYVENNIFDCSYGSLICWHWNNEEANHGGFHISGNTYYQRANPRDLALWYGYGKELRDNEIRATNQAEFEKAIARLDKSPKLVKWLED